MEQLVGARTLEQWEKTKLSTELHVLDFKEAVYERFKECEGHLIGRSLSCGSPKFSDPIYVDKQKAEMCLDSPPKEASEQSAQGLTAFFFVFLVRCKRRI